MANSFLPRRAEKPALVACYGRYESDLALAQYCDAHFGPDKFGVTNFPLQLAQICTAALNGKILSHALDLGCAVGRASFELALHFDQVTGIDSSTRFIATAQRLKERGRICYQINEEGNLISDHKISLANFGLSATANRVHFYQGNAQQLEDRFNNFDLILASNLIDRLPDPGAFLSNIHRRLTNDGLLVIASPYNWLEHFTPRQKWLGGHFRCGTHLSSLRGMSEKLSKHFCSVSDPKDVEFVIRGTARTFNHSISQVTVWRRTR